MPGMKKRGGGSGSKPGSKRVERAKAAIYSNVSLKTLARTTGTTRKEARGLVRASAATARTGKLDLSGIRKALAGGKKAGIPRTSTSVARARTTRAAIRRDFQGPQFGSGRKKYR